MLIKKIKIFLIIYLFYQTPLYSKSNSFEDFNSKNLSKYFSGIVAFENKDNTAALDFFNSSKILLDRHDPYLKRYIYSLVLENKVSHAINVIKINKDKTNTDFFDAYLLLILDSLKKKDYEKATIYLREIVNYTKADRIDLAILESLKQYIFVFRENKILNKKKNLGKLTNISEAFQKCYLGDDSTDIYFSNLINDNEADYTRYIYFYLSYLIENNKIEEAKKITKDLDYINNTLLLSQGKSWIESKNTQKFKSVFSCKNSNNFEKSNFYLNLSNFLNPKFIFNLSLVVENQYLNEEYKKAKKTLKKFKKQDDFYYWYRVKKEAQIIAKLRNKEEALNYITAEFYKINEPNNRAIFDIANFYKSAEDYEEAIKYYTKLINTINNSEMKSDLLYRRGGSYERIGKYEEADEDLLSSLKINPEDAYVLNYLAYSWLERDYKINEAIEMLENAYKKENSNPYIIDSIGWAYYLVKNFEKAEKFLKTAVELMPEDPTVNDHYGDILWKLDRKIQARYFWGNVLKMESVEAEMIQNINIKMIEGLKDS